MTSALVEDDIEAKLIKHLTAGVGGCIAGVCGLIKLKFSHSILVEVKVELGNGNTNMQNNRNKSTNKTIREYIILYIIENIHLFCIVCKSMASHHYEETYGFSNYSCH